VVTIGRCLLVVACLCLGQVLGIRVTTSEDGWTIADGPVDEPASYVTTAYTLPTGCEEIDVGASLPAGCAIITVDAGQNFQTALTTAAGRTGSTSDIIRLAGASTFTGTFNLPAKSGTGWVYIISTGYANLPAAGNRIIPDDMGGTVGNSDGLYSGATANVTMGADVATIEGSGSPHVALTVSDDAAKYRFIGVELRPASGQFASTLLRIYDESGATDTSMPEDIIFDRVVARGDPSVGGRRGFLFGCLRCAVINSFVADWWDNGSDAQAILLSDFTDVFAAVNNYLEASGENFFSDTGTNTVANQPHDIEFRGNLVRKANDRRAGCDINTVKNLFEVKAGHRILVEGNEFQDHWADDDSGNPCGQETAINIKQGDEVSNKHTTHFTFRLNRVVRVAQAIKVCMAHCNSTNDSVGHSFAVYNNIIEADGATYGRAPGEPDGGGLYHFVTAGDAMLVDHNTFIMLGGGGSMMQIFSDGGVNAGQTGRFSNNIILVGSNPFETADANDLWPGGYTYNNNLLIGGTCANFPANNQCPAAYANVGFVNFNSGVGGDYELDAGSAYKGDGNDPYNVGTNDPGANVDAVTAALACATTGQVSGQCASYNEPPVPSPLVWLVRALRLDRVRR
jgi:hypothetical protein